MSFDARCFWRASRAAIHRGHSSQRVGRDQPALAIASRSQHALGDPAADRPLGHGQAIRGRGHGHGRLRLFVIRLTGATGQPVAVPSSTGHVYARTAWSADRSWLFYQGPGGRMWAYQASSGKVRASSTPCCSYTVMAAFPSGRR